jgi:hypothetical protein
MTRVSLVTPAAIVFGLVLGAAAQEPQFRGGTHTVSVYATVADQAGHLAPDLTKDDFEVFDDGKPQPISLFSNDIQPITIVVMLDRSGSMEANFGLERRAAETFVTKLLPDDRARVGSFSERIEIDPETFTTDRDELLSALHDRLQPAGPTPLWNATAAAMTALAHQEGRRVVLVSPTARTTRAASASTSTRRSEKCSIDRSRRGDGLRDRPCKRMRGGKDTPTPCRRASTCRGGRPDGPRRTTSWWAWFPIGPPGFPPIPPVHPGPIGFAGRRPAADVR